MPSLFKDFLWRENEESMFLSFHPWLIKQITNTYQNHFLRSYENRSKTSGMDMEKDENEDGD